MSEERMAILRMLSEGKISVDEASRLLEAVGDGPLAGQGAQESRDERRQPRDFGEFFEDIGEEVRRAVSSVHEGDIGDTVRKEVDKAMRTVRGMDLGNVVNEVVDQVKVVVSEAVDGASNREIIDREEDWIFDDAAIVALQAETGNGNIVFQPGTGTAVKVYAHTKIKAHTSEQAEAFAEQVVVHAECTGERVRIYKEHPKPPRGVNVTINYKIEGPRHLDLDLCTVNGNATASGSEGKVTAQTTNGNVALDGSRGQVQLRTQNGNIRAMLLELRYEGLFTNANGNIEVHLVEGEAPLTATSTNGNIDLRLPVDFSGVLDARTTNGRVRAAADLGVMGTVKRTLVEGPIGAGGDTQVRVHTLNGNVSVGRLHGEEQ
jgi:DUF4097 and DUF4098 domain-containing protein YvlB